MDAFDEAALKFPQADKTKLGYRAEWGEMGANIWWQ